MKKSVILKMILIFNIITFSFFFFGSSAIAEDPLKNEEIRKISPKENALEKIFFIKNKFEKNRTYTTIEDENTFKSILTGVWFLPPEGEIKFKSDGRFEAQNGKENKSFSGFWEFSNRTLRISSNKKSWESYKVKKYGLSFHELRRNRGDVYGFSINFDKMLCGMSSVLTLDFYTK